ncbi:MAG: hypothetical protein OER86_13165 [Phycisphaerae bacterium]|nr:hypothetical protein [Phycisphaerae bacterium]
MSRTLSALAVVLAASALAWCAWLHTNIEQRVADEVARHLQQREADLVAQIAPRLKKVFADFDVESPDSALHPTRLEDVLRPLLGLVESLSQ